MNINKRIVILYINPVLLFLLSVGTIFFLTQVRSNSEEIGNTEQTIKKVNKRVELALDAESSFRGYVLTKNQLFFDAYMMAKNEFSKIEITQSESEIVSDEISRVDSFYAKKAAFMDNVIYLIESNNNGLAVAAVASGHGKVLMDSIQLNNTNITFSLLNDIREKNSQEYKRLSIISVSVVLLLLLNLVLTYLSLQNLNRDIEEIERINNSLEQNNANLTKLFTKTYHHLREPLRSISGFAILLAKENNSKEQQQDFKLHLMQAVKQMEQEIKTIADAIKKFTK